MSGICGWFGDAGTIRSSADTLSVRFDPTLAADSGVTFGAGTLRVVRASFAESQALLDAAFGAQPPMFAFVSILLAALCLLPSAAKVSGSLRSMALASVAVSKSNVTSAAHNTARCDAAPLPASPRRGEEQGYSR